VPFDISAAASDVADDDGDPVEIDAATAFVERLETLPLGTALCEGGLDEDDTDDDGFPDRYLAVLPGTPLCWSLTARSNTTVEPTMVPQLYRAAVEVRGDGVSLLDTRDVYFLVPPVLVGPGVD
jgi:hypothetical protein